MEDQTVVLLIIGLFVPIFLGVIWHLNRVNPVKSDGKRPIKAAESSIVELYEVQTKQIKDIVEQKNKDIKSLQARLRQEVEEETPAGTAGEGEQVRYEDIKTLVSKSYPKYAKYLDLPFVKKEISKATKGMTLDEALTMVENWTGKKISRDGKSESGTAANEDNPNYF